MLLGHLDGILNYCGTKVRFGVVEAINGKIKTLLRTNLRRDKTHPSSILGAPKRDYGWSFHHQNGPTAFSFGHT